MPALQRLATRIPENYRECHPPKRLGNDVSPRRTGGSSIWPRFALELGQRGITVNAVAPGFVRTDLTQRGRGAADWPGTEERFAARAMMGRIGEPEDVANAVVFLASPESGWITAQVLTVDGGRMDYIGHG